MRLTDKVVIVTGAARGIGKAIAVRCAEEGARVAIADVRDEQGQATAHEIEQAGGRALFVHCDVSRKPEVAMLVQKTVEAWGRIDVLVNDAGICPLWDFTTLPEEIWDQTLDVNLKGTFLCSQAVSKVMIEKGIKGRIINISSISSIVGGEQQAHYCSTKAGINLLTASMAIALGPYGINCNAILPGPVETDINRDDLSNPEKREYFIRRTPLRRIGQPEDVAGPVIFFATEDSAWCTGTTLVADGGILINFQ
jgi:L-rhamnose 1-dehydrogenase